MQLADYAASMDLPVGRSNQIYIRLITSGLCNTELFDGQLFFFTSNIMYLSLLIANDLLNTIS